MRILIALPVLALLVARGPDTSTSTTIYDAVVQSAHCTLASYAQDQMNCDYDLGPDLRFSIAGVGLRDGSFDVQRANADSRYWISYGVAHGCIIVGPGKRVKTVEVGDHAFVSLRTGRVYHDWHTCGAAGGRP